MSACMVRRGSYTRGDLVALSNRKALERGERTGLKLPLQNNVAVRHTEKKCMPV